MEREDFARRIQQLRNDGQDDFADAIESLIELCQSMEPEVLRLLAEQKQNQLAWEAVIQAMGEDGNEDGGIADRACRLIERQRSIIKSLRMRNS